MGPGRTRNFFVGKSSQNSSKPVLIFCVFCLYIHCYMLLVIMIRVSFHVNNGFPKKKFGWGGVSGVSSVQVFKVFFEFF